MRTFGAEERRIADLLKEGRSFVLRGYKYTITFSGKPTCAHGEPKTDIYVWAVRENGEALELKISYKKENANFIENKTNAERAEALFGPAWQSIIRGATLPIQDRFFRKPLIYRKAKGKTERGSITLGWKYELLNVPSGKLSGKVELTREQTIDAYAGTHLSWEKKNAYVNGICIPDSGVANCILIQDHILTTQQAIDKLYTIEDYVTMYPNVYFACKALNYRTFARKYDGDRPLAVFVDWYVEKGQLCHRLVFDNPLQAGGNETAFLLLDALNTLGVSTTEDLHPGMVRDPGIIYN